MGAIALAVIVTATAGFVLLIPAVALVAVRGARIASARLLGLAVGLAVVGVIAAVAVGASPAIYSAVP